MKKLIGPLIALLCGTTGFSAVRPFTVEGVLQDLSTSHPHASRVSDELPPGVSAKENITYSTSNDGELGLDIYRPSASGKLPTVLMVHGGGWLSGTRQMERPFAKHLAARGYVVVPVSYRLGAPGRFPAPVHDLKLAVRWLRLHAEEYGVDPTRIAIAGGSAGGTLAAFVGATNGNAEFDPPYGAEGVSSAVQAVIDIDGTATFMDTGLIRAAVAKPDNPYYEYLHGPYATAVKTWIAASPLLHVTPKSAPTLFIKSTVTQPILVGREEMCDRLGVLGVRSEIIVYPNSPHPFWLVHPWFEQTVEDADQFLKKCFSQSGWKS